MLFHPISIIITYSLVLSNWKKPFYFQKKIPATNIFPKGLNFRMVDVGGQRSERKKWIHCFDEAKAVIFVAALSDYDLTLTEDPICNRMSESLRLFGSVCNNRWFVTASMIVFLNKSDIFMEKLKKRGPTTIKEAFPDFNGDPYDYEQTTNHIQVSCHICVSVCFFLFIHFVLG